MSIKLNDIFGYQTLAFLIVIFLYIVPLKTPVSKAETQSNNNLHKNNDKFSPRVLSNSITDLQNILKSGSNTTKKAFKLFSSSSLLNKNNRNKTSTLLNTTPVTTSSKEKNVSYLINTIS